MSDETITPEDIGKLVAAEYVLGLLSAEDRAAIERRIARDPAFAADVAFWEERLLSLLDSIPAVAPPVDAWTRIETALDRPAARKGFGLWRSLAFWRVLAVGTGGLAAASLAALFYLEQVQTPRAPLVASLEASGGQASFVATVTPARNSLMIVPASLSAPGERSLELWLIPAGGQPRSLGLVAYGRPVRVNVPPALVAEMKADAVLAVSLEPPGGSPTGQPTGQVIANGKLTSL